MKVGIMQPYIFPYIGYFQLINSTDKFVIYDNIQFTKKGWINRNRILINGKDDYISFPVKKASDFLNVNERYLSNTFSADKVKLLRKIKEAYRKAPEFNLVYPLINNIIDCTEKNLFQYIFNSIKEICVFLEIKTKFIVCSSMPIDHTLTSQEKVLTICKTLHADQYINSIGGKALYLNAVFEKQGIQLNFLKSKEVFYQQLDNTFVPWLSIIDILMFNPLGKIKQMLFDYEIILP